MKVHILQFRKIKGLFEPSGVVQTKDGTVLAVDDELKHAVALLRFGKRKRVLKLKTLANWPKHVGKVDDLEALTADPRGYIYAITSHSPTSKGRRKSTREKLLRFQLNNGSLTDVVVKTQLLEPIYDQLIQIAEKLLVDSHDSRIVESLTNRSQTIDIEGLAYDPHTSNLLIGLRNPLINDHALVVVMHNPDDYFAGAACQLTVLPLNLKRGGIRSLAYDATLGAFLIVASRKKKRKKVFTLWLWRARVDQQPQKIRLNSVKSLRQTEAIAEVQSGGKSMLLLLSDEGSARHSRSARYLFLDYKDLLIN